MAIMQRAPHAAQALALRQAVLGSACQGVVATVTYISRFDVCLAVAAVIKLNIEAGKANPSPPVGPALGAAGVNIMDFCKQYNAATQDKAGEMVPAEISVMDVRHCANALHALFGWAMPSNVARYCIVLEGLLSASRTC